MVFTVFYIPTGLKIIAEWLNGKKSQAKQKAVIGEDKRLTWFGVLMVIGIGICLPKLFRPVGADKPAYIETCQWLRDNTNPDDVIAAADRRLYFYSDRKGFSYKKGVSKKEDAENDQRGDQQLAVVSA